MSQISNLYKETGLNIYTTGKTFERRARKPGFYAGTDSR